LVLSSHTATESLHFSRDMSRCNGSIVDDWVTFNATTAYFTSVRCAEEGAVQWEIGRAIPMVIIHGF
jgi:hypothetical protein